MLVKIIESIIIYLLHFDSGYFEWIKYNIDNIVQK